MPEGDTIHAAAARVRSTLGYEIIRLVDGSRLATHSPRLVGEPVSDVWSHGKHLIIESATWAVRTHLGMHGRWTTHEVDRPPRVGGSLRGLVATDNGVAACWSAPDVVFDRAPSIRQWLDDHQGPDLIRTDPGDTVLIRAAADPSRTVAEVLLDQRVAAGIGNVYKSELCFRAGVHPFRPIGDLSPGQLAALFDDAAVLLRRNSHRMNRMTTEVDRPGQRLWVYGRPGRGCRRCNRPIERDAAADRVTFWCPRCQPAP